MAVLKDMIGSWRDTYSVQGVFGDPIEKEGVTVIPVAMVSGGGGGWSGPTEAAGDAENSGGGFGGMARPTGVYVIRANGVEWKPAVDVTLLAVAGIGLGALIALVLGRALRRRR